MKRIAFLGLIFLSLFGLWACSAKESGPKELDRAGADKFAKYLKEHIKESMDVFSFTEYDVSMEDEDYVTLTVPDSVQVLPDIQKQQIADYLLGSVRAHFRIWAKENGYKHESIRDYPYVFIFSQSRGSIAMETGGKRVMELEK